MVEGLKKYLNSKKCLFDEHIGFAGKWLHLREEWVEILFPRTFKKINWVEAKLSRLQNGSVLLVFDGPGYFFGNLANRQKSRNIQIQNYTIVYNPTSIDLIYHECWDIKTECVIIRSMSSRFLSRVAGIFRLKLPNDFVTLVSFDGYLTNNWILEWFLMSFWGFS